MSAPGILPTVIFSQSPQVGGTGGNVVPPWAMPNDGVIVRIEVKSGLYVNQIVFHYTSATNGQGAITLGGYDPGGAPVFSQPLASGEVIQSISGNAGAYLDTITIVTAVYSGTTVVKTNRYGPFGTSTGGKPFPPFVPPSPYGAIVGLFGRAGAWIDAMGVVYAQNVGPGTR